jgi:hypothetical protein
VALKKNEELARLEREFARATERWADVEKRLGAIDTSDVVIDANVADQIAEIVPAAPNAVIHHPHFQRA